MRGVTLLILGRPTYAYFAANMMVSLKRYSPDIKIQCVFEKGLNRYLFPEICLWDVFTEMSNDDCYENGILAPGKAKLNLYKYYAFDETLYLDVDGICVKDITPLFDNDQDFKIQHDAMHWASQDNLNAHFGVDSEILGSNSSVQFIRKGELTETIYTEAAKALNNPLPLDKQSNNWFNMQPDELYFGIGMNKAGLTKPYFTGYPIFFRTRSAYGAITKLKEIQDKHYVIGSYGSERYNHKTIRDYYDKLNIRNWREVVGINPYNDYKHFYLMKKKHNKR